MSFAQECVLKLFVIAATLLAVGGALMLFFIGLLANGSAISDLDFSWPFFIASMMIAICQAWLAIAGCRSACRWIDNWSIEIADKRNGSRR